MVVGDADRIVEAINRIEEWILAEVPTQYPVLVKIGGVPDFPQQGIDDGQHRPLELVCIQAVDQRQGALAGIFHCIDQKSGHVRVA